MRNICALSVIFLLLSCYGLDNQKVQMHLRIPLNITDAEGSDYDDWITTPDQSIDTYFAMANVFLKGTLSGEQQLLLNIGYDSAKNGNYYFDSIVDAAVGERITISFGGYYYINDNTVGGFVSTREFVLEVKDGIDREIHLESLDLSRCEVSIKVLDESVSTIIFYDATKGIFLKSVNKSLETGTFVLNIPEGTYDIYSVNQLKEKKIIKRYQEIKGKQHSLEI